MERGEQRSSRGQAYGDGEVRGEVLAVEDQGDARDEGGIEEGHSDQEEHESFEALPAF